MKYIVVYEDNNGNLQEKKFDNEKSADRFIRYCEFRDLSAWGEY